MGARALTDIHAYLLAPCPIFFLHLSYADCDILRTYYRLRNVGIYVVPDQPTHV